MHRGLSSGHGQWNSNISNYSLFEAAHAAFTSVNNPHDKTEVADAGGRADRGRRDDAAALHRVLRHHQFPVGYWLWPGGEKPPASRRRLPRRRADT